MNADISVIDELDFEAGTVRISHDEPLPALKYHYVQQAKRFGEEGIDAIYFSGEYPSVYFKRVSAFTPDVVREIVRIQRKVWNQGKVPLLYVESDTQIRIYNCYDTPRNDKDPNAEDSLLLFSTSLRAAKAENDLDVLRTVFNKVAIESGNFWQQEEYANRVDVKKRVDRALIDNIKKTRRQLRTQGLRGNDSIIHDLLLRSLFILYLEDRGATNRKFYETYLPGATSYFDILKDLPATYRLFETLETAFNGNLSPVQPAEFGVVTAAHLDIIKRCFWSDWGLSNQLTIGDWKIFDFGFIPIQIISEIYEDFLSEEKGTDQMAKTGTFYTPHALAEFVLNQVLPYPSLGDAEHNIRTIDPTCGSGIFLVDTLNRLLDRWEYANPTKKLTFDIIKDIVLSNIFGVEIQGEAIKVTAFSIYLAMLDRLDPKTLWQNNRFPYLIYDEDKPDQQQGKNLFRMSSLGNGPFAGRSYDLVVGNPPFTNKVSTEVMAYLTRYKFGKETVIAFLHRVTELCPTGKIALLSTSKILFNNGSGYQRFRQFLFNDTYVEKVYNFSAFRRVSHHLGGRNLFASATSPICVFVYTKSKPSVLSEKLIYYTPTTTIQNRLVDGITIDPTDEKFLPREECQKPDTKLWKVAMWGTERDFAFLQRLKSYKTLNQAIVSKGWSENKGVGFQTSKPEDKHDPSIKLIPYIDARKVRRYYSSEMQATSLDIEDFSRIGKKQAYKAPHLLIKAGQEKLRFCSSYLDYDCSFRKTIYGIHATNATELKLLSAYLNSSLAFYLMFLTTGTWGIEREEVKPNEILKLPDLCFSLPADIQQKIVEYFDEIITLKKQNTALVAEVDRQINVLETQIETALWGGLGLSQTERILIADLLDFRLDAFQGRQDSNAFKNTRAEDSEAYAIHLCQTINRFLQPTDNLQARANYFDVSGSIPLQVIVLHLDEQKRSNTVEKLPTTGISAILSDLEVHTYHEETESIYYRRFIRYYNGDTIYIVKPNERRFWSRSMALSDADEIILEILTSEA